MYFFSNHRFTYLLQLADAKFVIQAVQNVQGSRFPVLTPNLKVAFFLGVQTNFSVMS